MLICVTVACVFHLAAKYEELYAFLYNPKQDENDRRIGWAAVNLKMEFERMGLPNDLWELTDLNKNYGVSAFFPPLIP